MTETTTRDQLDERDIDIDVAILGGGLAGLSLAIQLKRTRAQTRVTVLEKRPWPVREAAHKVGESLLQIGAGYFEKSCGMKDHLQKHQLAKMGLRFFLPAGCGQLEERVEIGLASWVDNAPTYQLDRGRFENALAEEAGRLGVDLKAGCSVNDVQLQGDTSTVSYRGEDHEGELQTRWVVDASGRAGILKRKLGLAAEVPHHCNAAWFRIGARIKVDDWSQDPAWRARVSQATRWRSTNHFMGPGYWFWVIPLASDVTSFGIVADPDLVPFEEIRRFEPLLEWLHRNEPVAAEVIERHREELQDFRVLKHYSHSCQRVLSPDRWCITGEAGIFLDPLYSPGSDAIGMANTMLTRIIIPSLEGEDMTETIELFNGLYLLMCGRLLGIWDHQYPLFGTPEVTAAKIAWDFLSYFSAMALLGVSGRLADPEFLTTSVEDVYRVSELNHSMQTFLREWNDRAQETGPAGFACITEETYLQLEKEIAESSSQDGPWIKQRIASNADRVHAAAVELMHRVARAMGHDVDPARIDPNTFRLANAHEHPVAGDTADHSSAPAKEREPASTGLAWSTDQSPRAAVGRAYSLWLPEPSDAEGDLASGHAHAGDVVGS